jgi:hypothetical protein
MTQRERAEAVTHMLLQKHKSAAPQTSEREPNTQPKATPQKKEKIENLLQKALGAGEVNHSPLNQVKTPASHSA